MRSAEASSDAELVVALRRGEPRAFEELYARYHERIVAFVNARVGDHGRAEEITQDVFLSALRRMRDTERPIAFKPWIYEIAKNACIDQFRRSRRADVVSYDTDAGLGAAESIHLAARTPAPDAVAERRQSLDDLLGAFGGLSRQHHDVLVMRELEGRSYEEIAERLDMTRSGVESTLFRARRRLGEEYQELVSGERCLRVQDLIATTQLRAFGARDRRRLSAHLSHCQPCRREAHSAGLPVSALAPRGVRAKIAALVPLPAFLHRRWSGGGGGGGDAALAQWAPQLGSATDPALASWARAAGAAVALAAAGVAGGHAVRDRIAPSTPSAPPIAVPHAVVAARRAPVTGGPAATARTPRTATVAPTYSRAATSRRSRTGRRGATAGSTPPAGGAGTPSATTQAAPAPATVPAVTGPAPTAVTAVVKGTPLANPGIPVDGAAILQAPVRVPAAAAEVTRQVQAAATQAARTAAASEAAVVAAHDAAAALPGG